ncbi:hypothetical protein IG631_04883 [Alternaria alternata]|nr:hypothetical protein IG631_04883 [Alternaria alternata]
MDLNRSVSRAANVLLVSSVLAILLRYGRLFVIDFFGRVLLFELNAYWNRCRVNKASRGTTDPVGECTRSSSVVACVIGYREEREVFQQCLRGYHENQGDGILIVCIDGTSSDDVEMRAVYEEVCTC